jgi:hypothetical protein
MKQPKIVKGRGKILLFLTTFEYSFSDFGKHIGDNGQIRIKGASEPTGTEKKFFRFLSN